MNEISVRVLLMYLTPWVQHALMGYCILIQVLYTFYIVSTNFLTYSFFSAKLPKKEKKEKEGKKEGSSDT